MNLFLAVDSFARASCSGLQSREGERRRRGRSLEKRKKERNEKRKEEGKKWTVKQHGSQRLSGASGPAINTNTTTTGVISFSFSSRSRRGIGGGEPLTKRCVFLEAGWSAAVHIGSRLSSARWIKSRSWTTFGIASAQRREQRLYSEHESSWMWPLGPGSSRCTRSTYLLYAYWAWMEDEAFLGNEIISLIKRTPSSRAYGPLEHRAIPQPADSKNRWREKRGGEKKKRKEEKRRSSNEENLGWKEFVLFDLVRKWMQGLLTFLRRTRWNGVNAYYQPTISLPLEEQHSCSPPWRFSSRYRLDSAFNSSFFPSISRSREISKRNLWKLNRIVYI